MSTTPSSAARICSCRRATRASRTEGGTSSRDQLINPRRMALALGHRKQAPWSPGQDLATIGYHAHGIAVHEVPDLRMIGVRMDNERHVGLEVQIDVLEHGGLPVYIKAQTVAAYAGVLRCHVVAEAMVAKNGVAFVGEDCGAAKCLDLGRRLPQHQAIEQGRRRRDAGG